MCWLSRFSGFGCCCCPNPKLRPGASRCVPGLAFASWALRAKFLDLLPQLPCLLWKKQDVQHKFLQHKGAHTDLLPSFFSPKMPTWDPQNDFPGVPWIGLRVGIPIPSAQKRLQMKIWRFYFAFAFAMERKINSPRFSFTFAFVMIILGMHKPQQQASLTRQMKIPEIFFCFRFRNFQQRENPKSWDFYFFFACNCFCEDGYALMEKADFPKTSGILLPRAFGIPKLHCRGKMKLICWVTLFLVVLQEVLGQK